MRARLSLAAASLAALALVAGCSPEKAMDFGPVGEVSAPPEDKVTADILRDFDGHDFLLGRNDHQAEVRLSNWPAGRQVIIPFWLGVNPLFPGFLRPTVGHVYVISEAVLVRPLNSDEYLIRAGSKMFKADTVFKATHTRYAGTGKMLPTVVRFVGTRLITVAKDAPESGTITEKVAVLREVSLPMRIEKVPPAYAAYEVRSRT